MNDSERQKLLFGNSHLIIKQDVDGSSMVVRLPWLPKKRALATEERSTLLGRLLSIWQTALFIYDDGGLVRCAEISCDLNPDISGERQDIGGWILVFGKADHVVVAEVLDHDKLASMNAQSILECTGAPCIIVSEPDDIEWTILFAKGLQSVRMR